MVNSSPKVLSVVVPILNERGNLESVCERVEAVMSRELPQYDYEILFTDNHSDDGSFEELLRLSKTRPQIRALRFSRNVGYQRSILTGLLSARGDAAIQLDADLEDPPELIPSFLREWERGAKVVYGIRERRQESAFRTFMRRSFYRILKKASSDDIPVDAGDFRLVDRLVLEQLARVKDQKPYLRGIIAAFGFEQVGISYERSERHWGESKFPYREMIGLAMDGIVNHSDIPLKLATRIGMFVSFCSFFLGVFYLVGKLVFQQQWAAGFATTTILILLSLGIISLLLGIIGEYLSRIHNVVRGYPTVIVEREISARKSPTD